MSNIQTNRSRKLFESGVEPTLVNHITRFLHGDFTIETSSWKHAHATRELRWIEIRLVGNLGEIGSSESLNKLSRPLEQLF